MVLALLMLWVLGAVAGLLLPNYIEPQPLMLLCLVLRYMLGARWYGSVATAVLSYSVMVSALTGYIQTYAGEITQSHKPLKLCDLSSPRQSQFGYRYQARRCTTGALLRIYSQTPIVESVVTARIKPNVPLRNSLLEYSWARAVTAGVVATASVVLDLPQNSRVVPAHSRETYSTTDHSLRLTALIKALVYADSSQVSELDWQRLRASGTIHLFVVSGLHLSTLFYILNLIVQRTLTFTSLSLVKQQAISITIILSVTLSYLVVVDWGLAASRAALMSLALLMFKQMHVRAWRYLGLLSFVTLWVVVAPLDLMKPTMWLSVVAVFILLAGATRFSFFHLILSQTFLTLSSGSILGQGFSWPTVLCNLVAIPVTSLLVLPIGLVSVLMGLQGQSLELAHLAVQLLMNWADWCTAMSARFVHVDQAQLIALVSATLLYLASIRWASMCIAVGLLLPFSKSPSVSLTQIDVGQGSAYLISIDKQQFLLDAGKGRDTSGPGLYAVLPTLINRRGSFDSVVSFASHKDFDHAGGFTAVQRGLFDAGIKHTHILSCPFNSRWAVDQLMFSWVSEYADGMSNDGSCVLQLESEQVVGWLTGDIERHGEHHLVRARPRGLDFISVPHHGSSTSSTKVFLKTVQPSLALLSRGATNGYNHPNANVISRYYELGARLIDSGEIGAITCDLRAPHSRCGISEQNLTTWWQRSLNRLGVRYKVNAL